MLTIGYKTSISRAFTAADVEAFAALTGDYNPLHISDEYAAGTAFGKRVVHGMLVASLFSNILGNIFPGFGTAYLYQELRFYEPVYLDEVVVAEVELIQILGQNKFAVFNTVAVKANGKKVIVGTAKVKLP